ncbi:energy-coupling factor transporter transmembrane component T [Methanobacterium alcaliphilum]|uniref:energy-coupling factor transporter transmembrane component T n=1 Tax=Methanobacterium alcaliphilum TaxID=392018 RepID=UPI00200AFA7E|nr:energy-coupling factor transporter transmembrane component T [Methanobacterium alcaliphilum]MCK9151479.1 energy-coupling factor transporter transmembrane protein EcfT [Methanobacterium alcaliphilum]
MRLTVIHPAVYIVYYLILIIFAFFFNSPYYLISFLICVSFLIALQGISNDFKNLIRFFIPMSILIIFLNPLVSHVGTTKIYLIGTYFITFESLVYGILMSLSLLIIILLFSSYNRAVSYQEMLYIFSKKFPNVSMIVIMALRFIPMLNHRLSDVNNVFQLKRRYSKNQKMEGKVEKITNKTKMLAVVIAWSLEESMITANSMKARGYGTAPRTSYLSFKFKRIDYCFLSLIFIFTLICVWGLVQGQGRIEIYPQLSYSFHDNPFNIYYFSFLILLSPLIYLELKERLIWQ